MLYQGNQMVSFTAIIQGAIPNREKLMIYPFGKPFRAAA